MIADIKAALDAHATAQRKCPVNFPAENGVRPVGADPCPRCKATPSESCGIGGMAGDELAKRIGEILNSRGGEDQFWFKAEATVARDGILIAVPDEPLSFVWQSPEQAREIVRRINAALEALTQ